MTDNPEAGVPAAVQAMCNFWQHHVDRGCTCSLLIATDAEMATRPGAAAVLISADLAIAPKSPNSRSRGVRPLPWTTR